MAKTTAPTSKTAAKETRRRATKELREFAAGAPVADIYFMLDVLINWRSEHTDEDLGIAVAFSESISNKVYEEEYIRVSRKHGAAVRRYLSGLEKGTIVEQPPTLGTDEASIGIQLPSTIRLSEDERVWVARLVRLLRDNYWVSELVRQILGMEAENSHQLSIKKLTKLLDDFSNIEALASNARRMGNNWSGHPILRAIRQEWPEIADYKDECSIRRIVDSAKGE